MDETTRRNLQAIIKSLKRGKPLKNVCLGCGISTDEATCPHGCKSRLDPKTPRATTPWSQIPQTCWDCGQPITTPPHLRAWQGLCPDCTARAQGERH